jgi:hypothetical protein
VFVRPLVADLIRQELGRWSEEGWICTQDLQSYRHKYVQRLLQEEKGEISSLDQEVIESLWAQEILSRNPDQELTEGQTFGQRMSDRLAGRQLGLHHYFHGGAALLDHHQHDQSVKDAL